MKKSQQICFIVFFLSLICTVPMVQTGYEVVTNKGHRVQMFDLVEDIFITPIKKANADAEQIDSLCHRADLLHAELYASITDTSKQWDPQNAVGYCDDAATTVALLKKSVLDYNRHVQGEVNQFAGKDTVRPYYALLVKIERDLDTMLEMVRNERSPSTVMRNADQLRQEVLSVQTLFGGRKGWIDYPLLTLTALRRTMVGADYLRPYEKEMEKSSVFANAVRPWFLLSYYKVFSDLGSKGILGRHEWFFYRPDVDFLVRPDIDDPRSRVTDPNDVPINDNPVQTIIAFNKQLAGLGIDLLFVIMPTKASMYPDLLNSKMKPELSGTFSHSLRIIKELRKSGIDAVDLFAPFAQERRNDASNGDSLYMRTDTHFKNRGVRLAAKVIADRVRQYPWFTKGTTEYAADSLVVTRIGDIGEMTGFPPSIMRKHLRPFQPEPARCWQVYRLTRDEKGAVVDRTLYKDDFKQSVILVLGDSFSRIYQSDEPRSAGWISHLALELGRPVASLVNDGGASTLVRQSLARRPNLLKNKKLVIWEVVERDFRFGEEGWKDVPIGANQDSK